MFRGANAINLDSKGRLAIPTKYRQALLDDCQGQMVCTIHNKQPCLLLYPLPEWEEIEARLSKLSSMSAQGSRLQRLLVGYANEGEMDKSGRILIPAPLREHAGLEKQIMLVGQSNRLELWNSDAWQQQILKDIEAERQAEAEPNEHIQEFSLS